MVTAVEGVTFNRLTVVAELAPRVFPSGQRQRMVSVRCECGSKPFDVQLANVRSGNTKSCGCLNREATSERRRTHGYSDHALYTVWSGMMGRCYSPGHTSYPNYGAQGIRVCAAWRSTPEGVAAFVTWCLAHGWREGLELDRIKGTKGYGPDNCRFVSPQPKQPQQEHNGVGHASRPPR